MMTDLTYVRSLARVVLVFVPAAVLAAGLFGYRVTAGAQEVAQAPVHTSAHFELDSGSLVVVHGSERVVVTLPGPVVSMQVLGPRAFVALGVYGAAVVLVANSGSGDAVVEKIIPVSHGEVTGFMASGDQLWMQVNSQSAILVDGTSGAAPLAPVLALPAVQAAGGGHGVGAQVAVRKADPAAVSAAVSGLQIVKIFNGQVLLNRGKAAGLRIGQQIKVVRGEQLVDEGGSFEGERAVATLVVNSINNDTSRAAIWRGDAVAVGDSLVLAERDYDASLMFPRQLHGFVEAEMHVRPLLNVGAAGFGVLLDDHITYFAESYYLGLRNEPLALGSSEGSTAFTQSTLVEGGYNSRPFAIGLAAGFTSVYGDLREMFEVGSSDRATSANTTPTVMGPWTQDMQHAFALGQRVRLGAMDGLNLAIGNTLLFFPGGADSSDSDDEKEGGFIWGGSTVKLTIPLAQNADLFFEGGGGIMGYAYGAVGVFGWISGNGGPGSLGLMASAGGAGIWGSRTRWNGNWRGVESDDRRIAGPMVSLGLRYRTALGEN